MKSFIVPQEGFMKNHEFRVLEHDLAHTILTYQVHENGLNPDGNVHGALLFTMTDIVAGMTARADGRRFVTQTASLTFLRGAKEGTLIAEAITMHRGKSTVVLDVTIRRNEEIMLKALVTMMAVSGNAGRIIDEKKGE